MANAVVMPVAANNVFASRSEPQAPGRWLRNLHTYLIQGDNVVCRLLTKIQNKAGVSKAFALNVGVALIFLLLLFARREIQQTLSTALITCYPTYCSAVVLTGKVANNADNVSKWLLFWTIYATFEPLVNIFVSFFFYCVYCNSRFIFEEPFVSFLPFYWLIKTLFVLALCLPPIDLCSKWIKEWIKPLNFVSQNRFDRQTFLDAHPFLLKEMNLERGIVKTCDEHVLQKELVKMKVEKILRSLSNQMPFNVPLSVGSIAAIASIPKNFSIVQPVN